MSRSSTALFLALVAGLAVMSAAQSPFDGDCRLEVVTRDYSPESGRMPGFDVHCLTEQVSNGIGREVAYEMAGWDDESNVMAEWGRDALLTSQLRVTVRGNIDARGRLVAQFVQRQNHPLEAGVAPGLVDADPAHPSNNGQGPSSRRLRGVTQSPNHGRSLAAFISQMESRTHDVVTLLIRFTDAAPSRTITTQTELQFRTDADSMYQRMDRISYGKVKYLDGAAYEVSIPHSILDNGGCDYSTWANEADAIFNADPLFSRTAASYRYRMYHIPPGNTCGWIARGSLCSGGCGSGRSWYVNRPNGGGSDWTTRTDTHLHELGHNAGMHHAGVGTNEYADTSCLMGYASTAMKGFNPAHQWYLGFYKDQTYTLDQAVTSSALLTIHSATRYVPGDNKIHIVEVVPSSAVGAWTGNLFVGFMRKEDFQSGTTYGDRVTITQWDIPSSSTRITWHVANLGAGQSFTEGAFTLTVNSIDLAAGSAEVFISFVTDQCPDDPNKIEPGFCGCNEPETDSDGDGTPNCVDQCDNDIAKTEPGVCGCGVVEDTGDADGDLVVNCLDGCPGDIAKTEPGVCGCNVVEDTGDADSDGVPNCLDQCPGAPDVDTDKDGLLDCLDGCPNDILKTAPGVCGCNIPDIDSDVDGTLNCNDVCPNDPLKQLTSGDCGCNNPEPGCGNGVCEADESCSNCPEDCASLTIGKGRNSQSYCCGVAGDGCDQTGCGECITIATTADPALYCSCLQDWTGTGCTSGGGGGGGGGGCTLGQKNDPCTADTDCCSNTCNTGRGVCK